MTNTLHLPGTPATINKSLSWVVIFSVAFAFVEASVVVYLRALYYPEGFVFPLKLMEVSHLLTELGREFSTIVMLVAAGSLAGATRWQKFSFFMIAFGVWDIFYYVWLKVLIDWPAGVFDWDILFLLPVPWIGPVMAPVLISLLLIFAGLAILHRESRLGSFFAPLSSWIMAIGGSMLMLWSFVADMDAGLHGASPAPFLYWLFFLGFVLSALALFTAMRADPARGKV